jgi:hypothetical protein
MKIIILLFLFLISCKKKNEITVNPISNCAIPTEISISSLRDERVMFNLENTDSISVKKVSWTVIAPDKTSQIETTGQINAVQNFTRDGEYRVTALVETTCGQRITLTRKETIKIKQGEIVWKREVVDYSEDSLAILIPTPDKGCVVVGTKNYYTGGNLALTIFKLNNKGEIIWNTNVPKGGYELKPNSIIITPDGGFLIGSEIDQPQSGSEYDITKINSQGTLEWQKTFLAVGKDVLTKIINTSDGGFLLGGYSSSYGVADKSEPAIRNVQYNYNSEDFWIIKITSKGLKQWDKTIGGTGQDRLMDMEELSDKSYLLTGMSYSEKSGNKLAESQGPWIVKVNNAGIKLNDQAISLNPIRPSPFYFKNQLLYLDNGQSISALNQNGIGLWSFYPQGYISSIDFTPDNIILLSRGYNEVDQFDLIFLSYDGSVQRKRKITGLKDLYYTRCYGTSDGLYMIYLSDRGYSVAFAN